MAPMFITALLPPGNIRAEINQVKAKLFSEYKLASLYALPSMIPVYITKDPLDRPESHAIIRQSTIISTVDPVVENGSISLQIDPTDICDHIAAQLGSDTPVADVRDTSNIIGGNCKLFLGAYEQTSDTQTNDGIRKLLRTEFSHSYRWKRSELTCMKVDSVSEPWWMQVAVRYLWKYPLKSSAQKR